jgi:hypothetical protein
MVPDSGLDQRLRAGYADAAEAFRPDVNGLLVQAARRGRRQRVIRRVTAIAALTAAIVAGLGAAVVRATGTGPPAPPAVEEVDPTGEWATPMIGASAWAATYRAAGGTATEAAAFLNASMGGPATTFQMILRVTGTEWTVLVSADGHPPKPAWQGTYATDGTRIHAHNPTYGCTVDYEAIVNGENLILRVLADGPTDSPGCGREDMLAQRAIYETAAFTRR